MSLEQALSENTAAINALVAVWGKLAARGNEVTAAAAKADANGTDYAITAGGVALDSAAKPSAPAKAAAPKPAATPAAPAAAPVEAAPQETAAESPSDDAEVIDLALLTKETTAAATRNRAGLVALLQEHGAARASAIPQDQWAAFVAKARLL